MASDLGPHHFPRDRAVGEAVDPDELQLKIVESSRESRSRPFV
jgi:hypothetical protein